MAKGKQQASGMGDALEIDKTIHEPARLLIMANLYVIDSADFTYLMHQTNLTYGNLSSHMSKLEEAGFIEVIKEFKGKRPNTMLKLTPKGREALIHYREQIMEILANLT